MNLKNKIKDKLKDLKIKEDNPSANFDLVDKSVNVSVDIHAENTARILKIKCNEMEFKYYRRKSGFTKKMIEDAIIDSVNHLKIVDKKK